MNMPGIENIISEYIPYVVSGAVGAALFRFLGKRWLENIFSKDLEAFKAQKIHEFDLLLTRKTRWHEKEYEVLSQLWGLLIAARDKLSIVGNAESLEDARRASMEFREYFDKNKIFLAPDLKGKFSTIDESIRKVWASHHMGMSPFKGDYAVQAFNEQDKVMKPLMDDIENLIQTKLFPESGKA